MAALRLLFAVGLCLTAVCFQLTQAANWALLVAGSNEYYNYRHQADICHAYHILKAHGVPQENIVTMMYDDIAYSDENPFPGNIINQPGGPNLYPGVVIDYKKEDVNPEVFLAVLSGNQKKVKKLTGHEGKVIKSGPDDHVFVNFADHGAAGLLAFPVKVLTARKLMATVKKMHSNNQYKKMVFYVEACESGSMFYDLLPDDINVYASTAANRSQSSYACYYDEKRETYLGDVYSVNWMEDSDKENLKTETLQKQFLITRQETNTSRVKEFGDMTISKMTVAEFQGDQTSDTSLLPSLPLQHPTEDAVPAREARLSILVKKMSKARTAEDRREAQQKIIDLMERQARVDDLFQAVVQQTEAANTERRGRGGVLHFTTELTYEGLKSERGDITQWGCYERALDVLMNKCPGLKLTQDYHAMGQLNILVNLCERVLSPSSVYAAIYRAAATNARLCGVL